MFWGCQATAPAGGQKHMGSGLSVKLLLLKSRYTGIPMVSWIF